MKLSEVLRKNFYKDDIQEALYQMDQPVSGNMDDLIKRLLKATKNDPEKTLDLFYKDDLAIVLKNNTLPKSGTKVDLIDRIIDNVLDKPMRVEKPREKKTKEPEEKKVKKVEAPAVQRTTPGTPGFDELIKEIEGWIPKRRYPKEDGYQGELAAWLDARGYRTRLEKGESRTDILVDEKIPIEIKKNPSKASYNRAYGQVKDHLKAYGLCLVVVCDVARSDAYEDFVEDIGQFTQLYPGSQVEVIRK